MKHGKIAKLIALLLLSAVPPAAAGPREDADAAYARKDYKTAAQDFTLAASQGDDVARAQLGFMFAYGIGGPQDTTQALYWITLGTEHNNPQADVVMGRLYADGRLVKQDWDKAFQFYSRAADQGFAIGQTGAGEIYQHGAGSIKQDFAAAMKNFTLAASQNEAEAEYDLGFMYYSGEGVTKDYVASAEWFAKSANQGNASAATYLGTEFDRGLGVPHDPGRAAYYYRVGAIQGNIGSIGLLGEKYLTGQGVKLDYGRAYLLLNIAASAVSGTLHDTAIKQRDSAAVSLSQDSIDAAQRLGTFCHASGYLLCLDDSVSVRDQAADPAGSLAKLQDRLKVNPGQQGASAGPVRAATPGKPELDSTGTGFYVSSDGYIVTAGHVVKDCTEMRSANVSLKVVAADYQSDLAVLQASAKPAAFLKLRGNRGPRQGEAVVAIGFPLAGLLGTDQIVTSGIISALAGIGNDRRDIHISAPVQPGNSGGPVVGEDGALVGVLHSKLDDAKIVELIGQVPQNVNFAVSAGTLQSFLNANQVPYVLAEGRGAKKTTADIAAEATHYTVLLECWK
jgi:hypothetical protein